MTIEAQAQAGVAAWQRGDAATARAMFEAVVAAGRATPQLWLLLAQACTALNDDPGAHIALDQVLGIDRRNLFALMMKGDLLATAGDDRGAAGFYGLALANAPPPAERSPDLAARLDRAAAATAAMQTRFAAHLDTQLDHRGIAADTRPPRFVEALDILTGAKTVYVQQPTSFYYPGLPQRQFYDPAAFDWIPALLAAAPTIRAELDQILAGGDGLRPYVEATPGRPNRGHALLGDPSWSAWHLLQAGDALAKARHHAPLTLAALELAPLPRISGRSPMALFSVLRPRTHIPPHTGMLNTRLICHIPLIVPDGCRLRVGNDTRAVVAGQPMIFDDSIEHEAWNDSDETRVVLLFEIWRPELDAAERDALTALFEAIGDYPSA